MSNKILVTGGSGFIGRNLAEFLADRYEVSAPTRQELDLANEEAVRDYLAEHHFDVVVHSATGKTNRQTVVPDLFKVNCRMFFNFARNRNLYGKLLHYGSGAEFGTRVPCMAESFFDTYVPKDDYGFAKYIAAHYTEALVGNVFNLRLFGVFGKYEVWEVRFISNAICRVLFDLPIVIRQNVCFDYLHVDDVSEVTAWFIENEPNYRTYNVCRGTSRDLRSLAQIVADVSGKNPEIIVSNPGMAPEYSGNSERMLAEIGPDLIGPLEAQIRNLYKWYEANRNQIDPAKLRFDG